MMTAKEAADLLKFYAWDHAYNGNVGSSRCMVCWQIEKDSWFSVRWCRATEYGNSQNGIIRFRNDDTANIVKKVWPLDIPKREFIGHMEVTIHESEIKELIPLIYQMASDATKSLESKLFLNGVFNPSGSWSLKAHEVQTKLNREVEGRRIQRRKTK